MRSRGDRDREAATDLGELRGGLGRPRRPFTAGTGEQTLPIWIFTNFTRANQLPIVNAVAVIVILISMCRSTSPTS